MKIKAHVKTKFVSTINHKLEGNFTSDLLQAHLKYPLVNHISRCAHLTSTFQDFKRFNTSRTSSRRSSSQKGSVHEYDTGNRPVADRYGWLDEEAYLYNNIAIS